MGRPDSFDTPITIGLPLFTYGHGERLYPSAARAGAAATPVNTAAAPTATAALQILFST